MGKYGDYNTTDSTMQYHLEDPYESSDDYGDGSKETLGFSYADEKENKIDDTYHQEEEAYVGEDDDFEELDEFSQYDDSDNKIRQEAISLLLNENDKYYKTLKGDKEAITREWQDIVKRAKSKDPEVRKQAMDDAIQQLSGYVHSIIERKYKTYYEHNLTFKDDLEQAGKMGIIKALTRYKPEMSLPTTYFATAISHELFELTNRMEHNTKSHVATTKKKIQEIQDRCRKEGYEPSEALFQFITGAPFRRVANVIAQMKINPINRDIDDPDAKQIPDSDPHHLSTEAAAISSANLEKLLGIIKQVCKRDPVLYECIVERFINGVPMDELAVRYDRGKDELANDINNVLKQLAYHDQITEQYPEFAPRDRRGRNLSQDIILIPEYSEQLKSTDLVDMVNDTDDELLRKENDRMTDIHTRFRFGD